MDHPVLKIRLNVSHHIIPIKVVRPMVDILGGSSDCVAVLMVTDVTVEFEFILVPSS